MSEQIPQNSSGPDSNPEGRPAPRSSGWVGGAILIIIGVVFLLQNLTPFHLENWWAIFILFPAIGSIDRAYRLYQVDRRISARVRNPLIWGILFAGAAVIFLLGGFGSWWPLLLVGAGLLLLLNGLLPD